MKWFVALACLVGGSVLAWHHPLWSALCLVALWLWADLVFWRPGVWLWVVPAALPVMNFSPWTGWLVFEEFDLLLLGTLAGAYARMAVTTHANSAIRSANNQPSIGQPERGLHALLLAMAFMALLGLWRGFAGAGGFRFDWYAGYTDALNSWRVFKSLSFALLFFPVLRWHASRGGACAATRLAQGMVAGMAVVTLAVLWERAAFPGIFDFSANYRTVALFWEMHVGGAAIDVYLAMSCPFVLWALVTTRRSVVWLMLALLAVLTAYACLTTFSRGVYLAVALPVLALVGMLWWQRRALPPGERLAWRERANGVLSMLVLLEVVAALVGGSFMAERLTRSEADLSSRVDHWRHGLDLLASPADWLLGKGLGRLPANYAAQAPKGEFPGAVRHRTKPQPGQPDQLDRPDQPGNAFVTLYGPKTQPKLSGSFALTQRVARVSGTSHQVLLDVRVEENTRIEFSVCERHLLYDRRCQATRVRVKPVRVQGQAVWQPLAATLQGDDFANDGWHGARLMMFSVSVVDVARAADIDNVMLMGQSATLLLNNGDFSAGMAQWFPAAQSNFLPWHLDNFYLEVLVERGLPTLLLFLAVVLGAMVSLWRRPDRPLPLVPFIAASLAAVLLVGVVSSVMDVPRVAYMFMLWLFVAIQNSAVVARALQPA